MFLHFAIISLLIFFCSLNRTVIINIAQVVMSHVENEFEMLTCIEIIIT